MEKEKRELARQYGMVRSEVSGGEIAEELEKERRSFQLSMCEVSGSLSPSPSPLPSAHPNSLIWSLLSQPRSHYVRSLHFRGRPKALMSSLRSLERDLSDTNLLLEICYTDWWLAWSETAVIYQVDRQIIDLVDSSALIPRFSD